MFCIYNSNYTHGLLQIAYKKKLLEYYFFVSSLSHHECYNKTASITIFGETADVG